MLIKLVFIIKKVKQPPPKKKPANRNGIPDEEGGLVSDGTELWDGTSVITKPQLTEVNLIAPNKKVKTLNKNHPRPIKIQTNTPQNNPSLH